MRYLHGSPVRQHGRLTSRNCVIDARWVLKVTDYVLPNVYEIQNIQQPVRPIEGKLSRVSYEVEVSMLLYYLNKIFVYTDAGFEAYKKRFVLRMTSINYSICIRVNCLTLHINEV